MMRKRLTAGASRGSRRDAPLDSCDQTKADRTGMVLVDSNAVERAQHVARGAHAEEGGGADGRQTVLVLAEVGVDAVVVVLILTLDGFYEIVGRDAELLGQLLDGVGLLDVAGGLAAAPLWLPAPSWSSCHPPVRKKPPDPELNLNPGAFVCTAV